MSTSVDHHVLFTEAMRFIGRRLVPRLIEHGQRRVGASLVSERAKVRGQSARFST